MSNIMKKGEQVAFSLPINTALSGAPQPVTVYDANMKARPIQSWERLILDGLQSAVDSNGASPTVGLFDGVTNVLLVSLSEVPSGTDNMTQPYNAEFPGEGLSTSVGATPYVQANSGGAAITLTGTGRIVNGKSQGVRPNYRELLTPGGNVGGI